MDIFKNDEDGYLSWHKDRQNSFVLNRFGGATAAFNVLHRSTCSFLWRDVDEGTRTTVEKWCSASEQELVDHANIVLGKEQWKRCGVCYRSPKTDTPVSATSHTVIPDSSLLDKTIWIPGEPAVWLGSGEKEWKQKATAVFEDAVPDERPQWIDIELRLPDETLYKKDLDNMLTPLLESARDAGWIQRGFSYLGTVTARKIGVSQGGKVGAVIKVPATRPRAGHTRIGVLVETDVGQFDADSVKWALYKRSFELYTRRPELRYPPLCPLLLDISVMIDDEQRRKSVQALMKPCIDGLEPILGHPDNLLPQPREQLQRRLAPQDEMVLSLAFHVRGGHSNRVSALISPGQISSCFN